MNTLPYLCAYTKVCRDTEGLIESDLFWLLAAYEYNQAGGVRRQYIDGKFLRKTRRLSGRADKLVQMGFLELVDTNLGVYKLTPAGMGVLVAMNDRVLKAVRSSEEKVFKAQRKKEHELRSEEGL